jgi:CheY-like chemotaxis protein
MDLRGARVLVVEDNADSLELMERMLRRAGAEVFTATLAGEALVTAIGTLPDVLVVDIRLPGNDGFALLERLRAQPPERGGLIPAVSVSGYELWGERLVRWHDAGFQAHVPKPLNAARLVDVVASLVHEHVGR